MFLKNIFKPPLRKQTKNLRLSRKKSLIRKKELETIKNQQQEFLKKKKEAAKKKEATHLAEKQQQQKLMTMAQERIAKINENKDKLASDKMMSTIPHLLHTITDLEIDSISGIKEEVSLSRYEITYREELASRLKLLLRLPEYGDVKMNLTLDRTGKVSKVTIVNADSTLNRNYIEKILPELSFPSFGIHYASAAEYTFSITLSNEI